MTRTLATIVIGLFLAGCGQHYWQGSGRGIGEFQTDSGQCIQEAKSKYEVSDPIYRRCMQARGWARVQTHYPSYSQFRGPEDEDEFFSSTAATSKTLIGKWSGTIYAVNGTTYPFTTTFRDDGSWHATSTLQPGNFDGAWRLNGSNVVWRSVTTGRTGTATLHEANGTRILRLIPDDRSSTTELTPAR